MKEKDTDVQLPSTSWSGIIINDSLKSYTEENSPFIKRKMNQARAVLSKHPLPDFKDTNLTQEAKK